MFCHGHCIFAGNKAVDKGGGIHAYAAVIMVKFGDKWALSQYNYIRLTITDNAAKFGGGAYFEVSSKLYSIEDYDYGYYSIEFYRNRATHGGAIFINDKTYLKYVRAILDFIMHYGMLFPDYIWQSVREKNGRKSLYPVV